MFDMGPYLNTFLSGAGFVTQAIKGLIYGLLAFAIIFPIQWWISFKNDVVLRVVTRDGKYIKSYKAKNRRVKGIHFWQLRVPFKKRVLLPTPPKEAIHMTKNGRYYAEANVTEENQFEPVWLRDTNQEYGAFEPLSTQERALHVQMLEDSEEHRKKSIGELLIQAAPYATMLIMFALVLVFFEDVVRPSQEIMNTAAGVAEEFKDITEDQARITGDLARIMQVTDIEVRQQIPPEVQHQAELKG